MKGKTAGKVWVVSITHANGNKAALWACEIEALAQADVEHFNSNRCEGETFSYEPVNFFIPLS